MYKQSFSRSLLSDIPAGVVVFLVALPLCLGIALASGAPLISGIISGVIGGVLVAAVSKSAYGVSGPAAGLAVIVFDAIAQLGSFEIFLCAVVIAGLFQIILALVRAGNIGYFFPNAVIKGMLSAIGILIILKQIPHALGNDMNFEGDENFVQADGHNTFSELFYVINQISPGALMIATISLAILIIWEQKFMKRIRLFQVVQGPLVAVSSAIFLNELVLTQLNWQLSGEHLVSLPISGSLQEFGSLIVLPDFSGFMRFDVIKAGLVIAIVASLETLLSVEAIDKLDPFKRTTPTNRELLAQGIGNIGSGMVGGLPITQVIVRSSANLMSGAASRFSIIFHGILLLFTVMLIPSILNMIPYAGLAAVLFMVGYKLVRPSQIIQIYKLGFTQSIPFAVTVLAIIFTNLLTGIFIGLIVAVVFILYSNFKTPYRLILNDYKQGDIIRIQLAEEISFLNKASFIQSFAKIPEGASVIIDASKNIRMDLDVTEIIDEFLISAVTRNINVEYVCDKEAVHSEAQLQAILVEHKATNEP